MIPACGTFSTTIRSLWVSSALYASLMPPVPSGATTLYRPPTIVPFSYRTLPVPSEDASQPTVPRRGSIGLGRHGHNPDDLRRHVVARPAPQRRLDERPARLGRRAGADQLGQLVVLELRPEPIAAEQEPVVGLDRLAQE